MKISVSHIEDILNNCYTLNLDNIALRLFTFSQINASLIFNKSGYNSYFPQVVFKFLFNK